MPFWNRDTLVASGSYATVTSTTAQQFDMQGYGWQTGIRYNHTLDFWRSCGHSLHGGFDFKQTNTNLDFGGEQVFASPADIAELVVGYEGLRRDCYGSWSWGTDLYISPGGFSSLDNTAAYQQIRPGALASFLYWHSYAERVATLPCMLELMGRVTGQAADGNLLPTEQLGFGGYDSIRGYDMRRVNGDSGYIVNLELRTQPICPGLDRCRRDQCQFLTFYDFGGAMNHTVAPGDDPVVGLSSVGIGARYTLAPAVALRFDYGWQLQQVAPDPIGSRAHISAVISR
jgi:hemolysin activation/secretion protein